MKFQAPLYVLVALVAATFATTITDVKNDLQSLNTQSLAVKDAIEQFPATGGDVEALLNDISGLGANMDKATSRVNDLQEPMTKSDEIPVQAVLANINVSYTDILDGILTQGNIQVADDKLPQYTQNLKSSFSAYKDALQAKAPAGFNL